MKYKIFHKKSCAYYPRANGQAKSTNKVLISLLRKMCYLHPLIWGTTYLGVVWAYMTAFKIHQQEEKRTIVNSTLEKEQRKRKAWHDRNLWKTEIKEGSLVLQHQPSLYNKKEKQLSTRWTYPYKIKEIFPQGALRLSTLEGDQIPLVNRSRLKPYQEPH
ncbi:hypothetical protein KP509_1Z105300 [Ceratopteris richardii]|nr:hypothetical protein KP509_1Z105300 [Ceratopteris richardii]